MRRPRILTGRWRSSLPVSDSSALEMERAEGGSFKATGRQAIQLGYPDPKPPRDATPQETLERFARDHIDLSVYRAEVDANFESLGEAAQELIDELPADEEEPDADR